MQSTFYTIYRTTNLINAKVYIGKHITQDLNDGYLGSGKLLRRAIDKYGVENFAKEILHVFDNEADMNACEAKLVTEEFVLQETNYNLCAGGRGGFSYINREIWTPEQRKILASRVSDTMKLLGLKPSEKCQTAKADGVQRARQEGKYKYVGKGKLGKILSEETKRKMSGPRAASSGKNNSQFGTRWITDGTSNVKIKNTDELPSGWRFGKARITRT
jgi:hypothetical protein